MAGVAFNESEVLVRSITLLLGGKPKLCPVARRVKDASGAACRECPCVFTAASSPYWSWRRSQALHERGTGHKMDMFALPEVTP